MQTKKHALKFKMNPIETKPKLKLHYVRKEKSIVKQIMEIKQNKILGNTVVKYLYFPYDSCIIFHCTV